MNRGDDAQLRADASLKYIRQAHILRHHLNERTFDQKGQACYHRYMSEITHTTIATWVMPILKAIEPFCDNSKALEQVGIDPNSISDSNQRIPLTKMRHLWKLAEDVSGDDCIGLEVIKYISPTSFHAIYNAHHASSSMRESLERLVTFSRIISTATTGAGKKNPDSQRHRHYRDRLKLVGQRQTG